MSAPRWKVIDRNGAVIYLMMSGAAAADEARELNRTGLAEFAPYRAVPVDGPTVDDGAGR